jgi:hypothetical protein
MKIRRPALLILLHCVILQPSLAAESKEAIPEMMGLTYKITNPDSTGTCFLISRLAAEAGKTETILVTAAHVFEKMSGPEATLVLHEKKGDGQWIRKEVAIAIRQKDVPLWSKHPEADVAALKVQLPENTSFDALPADQIAGDKEIQGEIGRAHV